MLAGAPYTLATRPSPVDAQSLARARGLIRDLFWSLVAGRWSLWHLWERAPPAIFVFVFVGFGLSLLASRFKSKSVSA